MKIIVKILSTALLHSLLVVAVTDASLALWGRPRGVAFGLTLYYSWLFFSLLGIGFAASFEYLQPKTALVVSLLVTLAITYLLWPGREPSYYLTRLASAVFCLALWWLAKRRQPAVSAGETERD